VRKRFALTSSQVYHPEVQITTVEELRVHDDKALEFGLLTIGEQPLIVSIKERVETTALFWAKVGLIGFCVGVGRDSIHDFNPHSRGRVFVDISSVSYSECVITWSLRSVGFSTNPNDPLC